MPSVSLWAFSAENYFFYCKQASPAELACLLFHGKGRNGKRYLLTLAPYGSIRISMKICCCPYVSSRKRLKIGGTQKILSRSDLDFLYGAQQLWGLKGACSPFLVAGWVESRGREGGLETPLPASGPAERPRRR